jgi:hypothetical protein
MIKNKKEFKELVERYETIGLDEINEEWYSEISSIDNTHSKRVAKLLTGFGSTKTCSLCKKVKMQLWETPNCKYCFFHSKKFKNGDQDFGCINNENYETYLGIKLSETPEELLRAFRKRAEHLRTNYSKYL